MKVLKVSTRFPVHVKVLKVFIRVPNKFCEESNNILKSLKMFSAVPDQFHIDLLQWDQLLLGDDIR